VVVGVVVRRRSQDDVHSVEHYHRKLHTLEEMRSHPSTVADAGPVSDNGHKAANGSSNGDGNANGSGTTREVSTTRHADYPASAVRISGPSTVRLTDPSQVGGTVPPLSPPSLAKPSEPVLFDDAGPEQIPSTFMTGDERAMEAINHRPKHLGGPLAAVGVVIVLVVVLIVTGLHSTTPSHSGHQAGTPTTVHSHTGTQPPVTHVHQPSVTPTTAPPVVSAPSSNSPQSATYTVGSTNYALVMSATSGECWLEATNTATGAVLFIGTLFSGQSHTVSATGPVTVVVGAPSAFAATVNGMALTLPQSYLAPITLTFQTPQTSG
jgi:hypothetical protein